VPEPDELTLTIARHLEVDWQYVERVEAWNADRIDEVRSAGRRAGRMLGYKIRTFGQTRDAEGRVVVVVVASEPPSAEEDRRMAERSALLIEQAWAKGLPDAGPAG
jgi:hypothetical protein